MIEEQVTVTVTKAKLDTLADAVALLEWTRTQDGLCAVVAVQTDGKIVIQVEGIEVPTVYGTLGDTFIWNGTRFSVEKGSAE